MRGLRGIGPALAGNVGASWAFALPREGDQDVDVPMLAPARSRCRFGYGESRGFALGSLGFGGYLGFLRSLGLARGLERGLERGLRGIGPALAGNVGAGWAFALSREGEQGVDVPMLAPARSRCRFVPWGVAGLRLGELGLRGVSWVFEVFGAGAWGWCVGLVRGVGAWVGAWARSRCRWGCRCCGDKRGRRVSGKNLSVGL